MILGSIQFSGGENLVKIKEKFAHVLKTFLFQRPQAPALRDNHDSYRDPGFTLKA